MSARIMVIDDTPALLELFQEILTDEGYTVISQAHGAQKITDIERARPDLIILDYFLDGAPSGWTLLEQLKSKAATALIPVIMCTAALNIAHEIERHFGNHKVSLLAKPFDIDNLLVTVNNALVS
jgi:CheY-like chemotaxis protein